MKRIGAVIVTLIFFIVLAYNAYYAPLPDIKVSNTETVIIPGVEKEYTFLFLTDMHMAIKTKQDLGASLGDADERMKAFVNEEGILSSTQFTEWITYANRLKPEGVLMCGDMIDYYSQENVEFLADNLQKLICTCWEIMRCIHRGMKRLQKMRRYIICSERITQHFKHGNFRSLQYVQ